MKLLALALVLSCLSPQEKVTLKFTPKKGDKLHRTEKVEMTIKAKVVTGEQEQTVDQEQRETQKSTIEFADVVDGTVTKSVIVCAEHTQERKAPPTNDWVKREKGLHGRTVTLTLKDGQIEREGVEGVDAKSIGKLDLTDRTSRIFPKGPVGPGDTWELQGDEVRKFLGADNELQQSSVKVKFLSIKDVDGKRCAVLQAVMDLGGKAPGGVDMSMKIDCEVVVWIERGYALSVKGKGTIEMKADTPQFKMSGEGPMTLEIVTTVD